MTETSAGGGGWHEDSRARLGGRRSEAEEGVEPRADEAVAEGVGSISLFAASRLASKAVSAKAQRGTAMVVKSNNAAATPGSGDAAWGAESKEGAEGEGSLAESGGDSAGSDGQF